MEDDNMNVEDCEESISYSVYILREEEFYAEQENDSVPQNVRDKDTKKNGQESSYVCEFCRKVFKRSSLLKAHLKTHTLEFLHRETTGVGKNSEKNKTQCQKVKKIKSNPIGSITKYICPECESIFTSKKKLIAHKKVHSFVSASRNNIEVQNTDNVNPESQNDKTIKSDHISNLARHKCPECESMFKSKKKLAAHRKIHIVFNCNDCRKSFSSSNELKKHTKSARKPQTCSLCSKELPGYQELQYHVKTEHLQRSKCPVCQKTLTRASDLKRHIRLHTDHRPFKCDECDRAFTEQTYLKLHKRLHTGEKPYVCDVCNKKFRTSSELGKHNRVHTGEKPYNCTICEGKFRTLGQLISHKIVHSDEKQFVCKTCGDQFRRSGDLKRHMFKHTSEKPHKCSVCEKRFPRRDSLNAHARIHTGEKPFSCDVCGKSFGQKHTLREHRKIHTGLRPFQCCYCAKSFLRKKDMKRHELTHTGEKPYSCKLCGKCFTQNGNLRKHERLHSSMRLNNVLKVVENALEEMEPTSSLQQPLTYMTHTEAPITQSTAAISMYQDGTMLMIGPEPNISNDVIQVDDSNIDLETPVIANEANESVVPVDHSPYTVLTIKHNSDLTVRQQVPIAEHLRALVQVHPNETSDTAKSYINTSSNNFNMQKQVNANARNKNIKQDDGSIV